MITDVCVAIVSEYCILQSKLERSYEIGAGNETLEKWLEGTFVVMYASIDIDGNAQCRNAVGKFLALLIN